MHPFARILNHLLKQNAWARAQITPYAGKTFLFHLPPISLHFTVEPNGSVVAASPLPPDVTLRVTPAGFLRFISGKPRDPTLLTIEGDHELGEVLRKVFSQLSWEAEEDLSRVLGDVLAHRVAGAARNLAQWGRDAVDHMAQAGAEYFSEERAVLVSMRELERFRLDLAALEVALAHLEQRVAQLNRS